MTALLTQLVGHVQQHQRWQAQRDDAARQYQMAMQVGGIQNHDDRVRAWRARHLSAQDIDRYLFIFGLGSQTINAGQIDQRHLMAFEVAHVSGMVFDGDAGEIADFLTQTGEPVEEGGLAGIGRADDRHRAIRRAEGFIPGPRHRMAAHGRGAHALVSEHGRPSQLHVNVA